MSVPAMAAGTGPLAGVGPIEAEVIEPRPSWRGWLHVAAALAAVPAGSVLLARAGSPSAVVGVSIFMAGLVLCFGTSAAYHRLGGSPGLRRALQRADHAMIYVLIAGTYTPVCLVALPWRWGLPLLSTVWAVAAAGIGLKVRYLGRYRMLEHLSYLTLGWCILGIAPVLVDRTSFGELFLLGLGGVLYSVGLPVLTFRRPDPWPLIFGYHEVWHVFTILAAGCHIGAVLLLVR
jgi:hemolysin III